MSIYSSTSAWGGSCSSADQSPINLSQSASKPCDLMCELVFDDVYISQANVHVSNEGLILESTASLGSCKFNGEGYTCNILLLTHPSHHTIENIQADAEAVAIFTNPTGKYLCVSSLIRVNPSQTSSSHFFNAFIPYANPTIDSVTVNLGEQWGLFMMVPPAGQYFVYDGSLVVPPCQSSKWCVFKSMINIDSNDFAMLVKNVSPGSRPIQPLGNREVFFNDVSQLPGGPMPKDGKTYMRCKRVAKKNEVKPVMSAPLGATHKAEESKKPSAVVEFVKTQVKTNGYLAILDVLLLVLALVMGVYYGWQTSKGTSGMYLILLGQSLGKWIRSFVIRSKPLPPPPQ